MRQKELRLALVCYGGISLAVYMHGVTKEVWKLARASRAFHAHDGVVTSGVEDVYVKMLRSIADQRSLRIRILPDIIAGASAGGINGVFLAQALHSGQSLEPLTGLWLDRADVDTLLDPDARVISRFFKYWAVPLVNLLLRQPGNLVSASVAPETRAEVRKKLSRLVRSRWFEAPFGGIGFSRLLAEAIDAMAAGPTDTPLLPPGHPLDLFVTVTDFRGHPEPLRLHSPAQVAESEHRLSIGFRGTMPSHGGLGLAALPELVLAARATASFPGAFPPLGIAEIDRLVAERRDNWPGRESFLHRILPHLASEPARATAALIDGSVLVNAPFAEAMAVLPARPAQREIDRRFVYIDPCPTAGPTSDDLPRQTPSAKADHHAPAAPRPPGWFSVIFGSLSAIPREQPIRDNLEAIERQSHEMARLRAIIEGLRGEVEATVERLFGHTLFLDRPTPRRLAHWREHAQIAAEDQAGYTYQGYARMKLAGIVDMLATMATREAPPLTHADARRLLGACLRAGPIGGVGNGQGKLLPATVAFLRAHDLPHRVRRLRLLARRLSADWLALPGVTDGEREAAREAVYRAMAILFDREALGTGSCAPSFITDTSAWLAALAERRDLADADARVDALLAEAMAASPKPLRRLLLLTYLGFPFYDVVTLPLLRGADLTEFDAVKVDRISPEDATAIRSGGAAACLRGVEFYNFGAFFSRAYRENDYLWGRLQGAERMIDLVASAAASPGEALGLTLDEITALKREAFLAILAEEEPRLHADPALVATLRTEVLARMG